MIITLQKLKDSYPFTLPTGSLQVKLSGETMTDGTPIPHILFESDGVFYALNGYARASGKYSDYEAIWRDHPKQPGQKVPMAKVMGLGLEVLKKKFPDVHAKIVG
jgi:hypothetical protein